MSMCTGFEHRGPKPKSVDSAGAAEKRAARDPIERADRVLCKKEQRLFRRQVPHIKIASKCVCNFKHIVLRGFKHILLSDLERVAQPADSRPSAKRGKSGLT
jgi:hypothetical protein